MRPLVRLLALASLLGLAACPPASSLDPNGKNGVLFFYELPVGPMSRYLEQSFTIPSRVTHKDLLWPAETRTFDFAGTTLEVSGAGIDSPVATLDSDGGYAVRFRCMTPSAQPTELAVRVMAGTTVRYADAIDITCYEPESLHAYARSTIINGGQVNSPAVTLGGQFLVYADLQSTVNGSSWMLQGTGFGFADAGPMSLVSETATSAGGTEEMVLRAERLGNDSVIAVGPLQTVLPIEVVPDDAWTLKVWTTYSDSDSHFLMFVGYAGLGDGGFALGLRDACTYQLGGLTGMQLDEHECSGYGSNQPDGGQLCIDAFGRSACGTW